MRCKSCRTKYPVEKFAGSMDKSLEEALADIPCDRL
ncbi:MAG: dual CXXC motif small (seleno)protein [Desulfobacterales bacterium]